MNVNKKRIQGCLLVTLAVLLVAVLVGWAEEVVYDEFIYLPWVIRSGETPTQTVTQTVTPTSTPTSMPTSTSTHTVTPAPTNTPSPTSTPTPCAIAVPAVVVGDTVWQANCMYIAADGVWVGPSVQLTIPEGVTIRMGSWTTFHVYGTLLVFGTEEAKVRVESLVSGLAWTSIGIDASGQDPSYITWLSATGSYYPVPCVFGGTAVVENTTYDSIVDACPTP